MRTSFFTNFASFSKDFREHLEVLWLLPAEQRASLIPWLLKSLRAETTGQTKAVTEKALAAVDGNEPDLLKSLSVLRYIANEWNPIHDTPQQFLDDLQSLSLLPKGKKEQEIASFVLQLFSALEQDNIRRLRGIYANSVIPNFLGVTTVVDIRPVYNHPFGSGFDDKLEDYEPNYLGWTPTILMHLRRSGSDPKQVVYQCDEKSINMLIDSLRAALRDLDVARSNFGEGEIPAGGSVE